MRQATFIVFFLGLLTIGMIGTSSDMLFQWPGYLLLGVAGVMGIFGWTKAARSRASDVCLLAGLVLAGYLAARAFTSPVAYLARGDLLLVLACFVVYALTAMRFTKPKERNAILWLFAVMGMVNFLIGLYHFSGHPEFGIIPGYGRTYPEGRVGGLFNNPNHMAAYVAFLSLACLAAVLFGRGGATAKLLLSFFSLMMAVGMVLTVSRGGLVGFAAGAFVLAVLTLFLVRHLYRHIFLRVTAIMGGIMVLGIVALAILSASYLKTRTEGGSTLFQETSRVKFWQAAVDQFATEPAVGTGARSYFYQSRRYRPEELQFDVREIEFTHNEYLQLLADYGLVGLGLLVIFLGLHVLQGFRFLRCFCRDRYPRTGGTSSTGLALVLVALCGLAAAGAHAFFEFNAHIPALAMLYAFGLGVLANPGFDPADYRAPRLKFARVLVLVFTALAGAWMVYGFFTKGRAEYYLEKALRARGDEMDFGLTVDFNRAKELDPDNYRIYYASGVEWLVNMRVDLPAPVKESFLRRALAEFEEAYRLFPYDVYTMVSLGNCLDALGRPDAAEKYFLEAQEWAPVYQSTRLAYAIHLHRMRRWDEARRAYEHAKDGHPLVHWLETNPKIDQLIEQLEKDRLAEEAGPGAAGAEASPGEGK